MIKNKKLPAKYSKNEKIFSNFSANQIGWWRKSHEKWSEKLQNLLSLEKNHNFYKSVFLCNSESKNQFRA